MKKIVLAMILALVGGFLVATPAEAALPAVRCQTLYSSNVINVAVPGKLRYNKRNMKVTATVVYDSCTNRLGPNFIRVRALRVTQDVYGTSMACANGQPSWSPLATGGMYDVQYKFYFKDKWVPSKHFDIPKFSLRCEGDTVVTRYVQISKRVSVPFVTQTPRDFGSWKYNAVADWRWDVRDPAFSDQGRMYYRAAM